MYSQSSRARWIYDSEFATTNLLWLCIADLDDIYICRRVKMYIKPYVKINTQVWPHLPRFAILLISNFYTFLDWSE